MKHAWILLLITMAVGSAGAQDIKKTEKIVDAKFIAVTSSLVASTIFDVETTYAAFKNSAVPMHEGNFFLRTFVHSGRPAIYSWLGGSDAAIIYASYRMKKSANPAIRKAWWIIPVSTIVTHSIGGSFNLRFTFH